MIGLDMRVALIFSLCLLSLNKFINFIAVNTIDIPHVLLPLFINMSLSTPEVICEEKH